MTHWMDTHCHLCLLKEEQGTTADIVARAEAAGVTRILDITTGRDNWQCVVDHAAEFTQVYAAIGIHPTSEMQETEADWQLLHELLQGDKVLAVGECGLDFYHLPECDCQHQYQRFERQIELGKQHQKPLIIHTRQSSAQTLDVMQFEKAEQAIMHCFVEDKSVARRALDMGYYLSFSGIATFKNATQVHDVLRWAPLDRIFIETDAPYLAPVPHRGKLNEPAYVAQVGLQMAALKNLSPEQVAEQLALNAQAFFNLAAE